MLKSIGVVVGCYLLSIVLVFATNPLLSMIFPGEFVQGRVPPNAALATSTALFVAIAILCAWLCARFAPSRPGRHVLWFAIVGEVMGLGATIGNWNSGWPHWYFVSWMIAWPISCFIGWRLQRGATPSGAVAVAKNP
jgi:hypothetical protein